MASAVVIGRLDRLGRTAKELTELFEDLRDRNVNLGSEERHHRLRRRAEEAAHERRRPTAHDGNLNFHLWFHLSLRSSASAQPHW